MPAPDDASPTALDRLADGLLRAEESEAWAAFERAWPALVRWLGLTMRALGVREDLREDCGQAALLRLWRSRMDYRGETTGALLAWVRTIVRNESTRLVERARPLAALLREPAAGHEDPTEDSVLLRDARAALAGCLAELPPEELEVVEYLYATEAPTERRVAEMLGRSKSRVHALRQSALQRLAACLRRRGIDG